MGIGLLVVGWCIVLGAQPASGVELGGGYPTIVPSVSVDASSVVQVSGMLPVTSTTTRTYLVPKVSWSQAETVSPLLNTLFQVAPTTPVVMIAEQVVFLDVLNNPSQTMDGYGPIGHPGNAHLWASTYPGALRSRVQFTTKTQVTATPYDRIELGDGGVLQDETGVLVASPVAWHRKTAFYAGAVIVAIPDGTGSFYCYCWSAGGHWGFQNYAEIRYDFVKATWAQLDDTGYAFARVPDGASAYALSTSSYAAMNEWNYRYRTARGAGAVTMEEARALIATLGEWQADELGADVNALMADFNPITPAEPSSGGDLSLDSGTDDWWAWAEGIMQPFVDDYMPWVSYIEKLDDWE